MGLYSLPTILHLKETANSLWPAKFDRNVNTWRLIVYSEVNLIFLRRPAHQFILLAGALSTEPLGYTPGLYNELQLDNPSNGANP